jgi:ABC-type transport system involved in multi-copper enzyme maturation permease subunit
MNKYKFGNLGYLLLFLGIGYAGIIAVLAPEAKLSEPIGIPVYISLFCSVISFVIFLIMDNKKDEEER